MKRYSVYTLSIILLLAIGCSPPPPPPEPTPNIQARMQAETEMESWFTDVRFTYTFCDQVYELVNEQLSLIDAGGERTPLSKIIESFNQPGSIIDLFNEQTQLLNKRYSTVDPISDKDLTTFKNLSTLNQILTEWINKLKEFPASSIEFRRDIQLLVDQYTTIENLLITKYPQSSASLKQQLSLDNPGYQKFKRLIDGLSNQTVAEPPDTPTPEGTPIPTETPEPPTSIPSKVWTDADGNIHMGSMPPENVEIRDLQGKVSTGYKTGEPSETPPDIESPTPQESLIWTDEQGNIHMGAQAPEGKESKKASDVKLMIGE